MPTKTFICGDSHASVLAGFARRQGIPFKGGPLGGGRFLESLFFATENDRLVFTPESMRERTAVFSALLDHEGPILSTVGFNSHRFGAFFDRFLVAEKIDQTMISDDVFRASALASRVGSLAFYRLLAERGRRVYFTCSPQIASRPAALPILKRFEDVLIPECEAAGAQFVDTRDAILGPDGTILDTYIGESIHGNQRWAAIVFSRFASLVGDRHLEEQMRRVMAQFIHESETEVPGSAETDCR